MQAYISNIIPRIKHLSQKLDNTSILTNKHWIVIDEANNSKTAYIFRASNELLISKNGKVTKGRWEYIDNNTLLIDINESSYLFKHGFFEENILALKLDNSEEYCFLVNETYFDKISSSLKIEDYLAKKYIVTAPTSITNRPIYSPTPSIQTSYKPEETPEKITISPEKKLKNAKSVYAMTIAWHVFFFLVTGGVALISLYATYKNVNNEDKFIFWFSLIVGSLTLIFNISILTSFRSEKKSYESELSRISSQIKG